MHFGDMRMTSSCNGMGTEGVVSAMFTFSVPLSEYPNYTDSIPGGAEIILQKISPEDGHIMEGRIFYVSSKSSDDVKVTVTCYDRMAYTECEFPCTDEDFSDSEGLSVGTVLDRITQECGLHAIQFDTITVKSLDFELPKSMLSGRSCRDVLSALSQVLCGYFVYDSYFNNVYFIAFGSEEHGNLTNCTKHEKIRDTSYLMRNNVYMTDSSGNVYGGTSGGSNTITVDSQLASLALYQMLTERIGTYIYRGWDCGTAIFSGIPEVPMAVYFEDEENPRYANYYDIELSSDGIVGSIGCNAVDEGAWVYKGRTQRELEKRYSEGDTWKNVQLTKKDGIRYVYVNENGENQTYGYKVKEKGVTVYEGNEISKNTAEEITVSDDVSEVKYSIGGIMKAVLSLVWDGDVLKSYCRKILDMDGKVIHDDKEAADNE
ncbi:MAG: hypothetical protein MR038_03185 [Oscillospiraceae bacterium]|nr:hypothetical protein [Oscillospiraceae bacterium]